MPTGNFGDIFAGYVAKKMGLPIENLILATNENDILAEFFKTGVYQKGKVLHMYWHLLMYILAFAVFYFYFATLAVLFSSVVQLQFGVCSSS